MEDLLLDRLLRREIGRNPRQTAVKAIYGNKTFVEDLDIVKELGGHSGCVNALSWSRSGNLLASGSDDQYLNVHAYQPSDSVEPFSLLTTVSTGHRANIFSVKFMPQANDRTLVTCAGDSEVRVFDIEYSGRSNISVDSLDGAPARIRQHLDTIYKGVRYLNQGNTNARVYKSHTERVKRIVTESSPYLFLTCSEDGEVRQFDLRLPSSAYPAPRGGRSMPGGRIMHDNVPPPLISYKRYGLGLNTISCSPSQPHYIALGGAHLHCFLHDRRMLGRDVSTERGQPTIAQAAHGLADHDDDLMGQATKCVRKFAPNGRNRMRNLDNGHITACKISDANPNELLVSWSGDHIYSFDIIKTPDVSALDIPPDKMPPEALSVSPRSKDRIGASSLKSRTVLNSNQPARVPQPRSDLRNDIAELARGVAELRRKIFYHHASNVAVAGGQLSGPVNHLSRDVSVRAPVESSEPSWTHFSQNLSDVHRVSASLLSAMELCANCLTRIDDIIRMWRYPLNPSEEEVIIQRTLRDRRNACRQFVQAAGTLSRVLLSRSSTSIPGSDPYSNRFQCVCRGPDERTSGFRYDFLKAVLLWLEGGTLAVIEGFNGASTQWAGSQDFIIPTGVDLNSGLDDYLVPHLLRVSGEKPIVDIDASRFEKDEYRKLFESETAAIKAFARVARLPVDYAHWTAPADMQSQGNTVVHPTREATSSAYFWGFKVSRGLLLNAGQGINHTFVVSAFGGTDTTDVELVQEEGEGRSQTDIPNECEEDLAAIPEILVEPEFRGQKDRIQEEAGGDIESDDANSSNGEEDDDNTITGLRSRLLRQGGQDNSRKTVEVDVNCFPYIRKYSGHCNVKTVKDVNFFGLQDDYVVSGSDCGNLFIWDKKTSQLLSILSADSEVVNVVQGHPYEPMLAASGIDNTIKIFSPDSRAQENARAGIDLATSSSDLHRSSTLGSNRVRHHAHSSAAEVDGTTSEGLESRKRMHESYRIITQNDVERQGRTRDAFIARSLLAQIAARLQTRRNGEGGVNQAEVEGDVGNDDDDDDCTIM